MEEMHGDIPQPSWEAILSEGDDPLGTVLRKKREDVADPFKPRVDDRHGKDRPLQESYIDEEARAVIKQLVAE